MKTGSTPNPAGDAAATKEAYIVVEIFGCGGYGDCNLFFSSASALAHIIQAGQRNPKWPPTNWRNAEDFLFSALPTYQQKLDLNGTGDNALYFHVRKISLSHQQQDGSAPQLDQITLEPEEPKTPYYIVCEFYKNNLQSAHPTVDKEQTARLISEIGQTWTFYGHKLAMPPEYKPTEQTAGAYIDTFNLWQDGITWSREQNRVQIMEPALAQEKGYWQPPVAEAQPSPTAETLVKTAIRLINEAQADPDNHDLIESMCQWRDLAAAAINRSSFVLGIQSRIERRVINDGISQVRAFRSYFNPADGIEKLEKWANWAVEQMTEADKVGGQ